MPSSSGVRPTAPLQTGVPPPLGPQDRIVGASGLQPRGDLMGPLLPAGQAFVQRPLIGEVAGPGEERAGGDHVRVRCRGHQQTYGGVVGEDPVSLRSQLGTSYRPFLSGSARWTAPQLPECVADLSFRALGQACHTFAPTAHAVGWVAALLISGIDIYLLQQVFFG
ncbi:hypothetical protein ABZT06_07945 [Streptomyces sp. NPDC005483]|uniref:hypothetical protein n=1 Tax=Streptomyces sp. NPDC005483 TaxID=3154882 RepID=UPI0033BDE2E7